MRRFTRSLYRAGLIGGAAFALSLAPMNARGQQVSTQTNASTQTTATGQQNTGPDYDRMDQFLNDHKNIDKDLRANPSLINSQKYLDHHKDLRTFLNDHPQMRHEFTQDRDYFMNRGRFDRDRNFRDRDQDRDRDANRQNAQNGTAANGNQDRDQNRDRNPNPDLRNWELARMDQFLDDHQQIGQQLTANPSLINDQQYLAQHQDLKLFLSQHPQVREEFTENPTNFMNQEKRFETSAMDRDRNPNPDLRNWELARMDQFLDDHQQIDQQLTANPSLVNNQSYLAQHQDLKLFLSQHPQVREEFAENPTYFMNQEKRFDTQEELRSRTGQNVDRDQDRDRDANGQNAQNGTAANSNQDRDQDRDRNFAGRDQDRDRDADRQNPNPDLRNWELARMDQFLDDHQQIDKELTAEPSLINDQKYLGQHKDLRLFLNDHPQVREEFAENPSYFMNRENRFDSREFGGRTDVGRRPDVDRNYSRSSSNVSDRQAKQMDQFLDKHKDIDRDLGKNPSLCNDDKYLKHHKDLRAFLDKNPEVRTQVSSNSAYFTQRHEMQEHHAPVKGTKPPTKTPIEQHETTTPAAATH